MPENTNGSCAFKPDHNHHKHSTASSGTLRLPPVFLLLTNKVLCLRRARITEYRVDRFENPSRWATPIVGLSSVGPCRASNGLPCHQLQFLSREKCAKLNICSLITIACPITRNSFVDNGVLVSFSCIIQTIAINMSYLAKGAYSASIGLLIYIGTSPHRSFKARKYHSTPA